MAIRNSDRLDKINQTSATTTSTPASSTNSSSAANYKNIDFSKLNQQNPIIKYITNPEFLALPKEEQLKKLQKQFPNIDQSELNKILNQIYSYIEQQKSDIQDTDMTLALDNGFELKVNIKEAMKKISAKKPEELTPAENFLLKISNILLKRGSIPQAETKKLFKEFIKNNEDYIKSLLPDASAPNKLTAFIENLAKEFLPVLGIDLSTFDEKAKQAFIDGFGDMMLGSLFPNWQNKSDESKAFDKELMAIALDSIVKNNQVKFSDIIDHPEKLAGLLIEELTNQNVVTEFFKDSEIAGIPVDSQEWINKTPDEQLNLIFDCLIDKMTPSYSKLSDKERVKVRNNVIDKIGSMLYGDKQWNSNNLFKIQLAKDVSVMKYHNLNIEDFIAIKKENPEEYFEAYRVYEATSKDLQISLSEEIYRTIVVEKFKKGVPVKEIEVTLDDQIRYLSRKEKEGKLSPKEKIYLTELKNTKNGYAFGFNPKGKREPYSRKYLDSSVRFESILNGKLNTKNVLDAYCRNNGINIKDLNDADIRAIISSCDNPTEVIEVLCKRGVIDRATAYQYTTDFQDCRAIGKALATGNAVNTETLLWVFNNKGNGQCVNYTYGTLLPENSDNFKKDDYKGICIFGAKELPEYAESIAIGNNKLETDFANEVAIAINTSEDISDSTKALYTQTLIYTAPDDDRRLAYGQNLSRINNPAVTEGLAAGLNSISDATKKAQYNSYVQTAAAKYPPEVQTRINTAIQTGKVSQQTLNASTSSSTSSSSSSVQAKPQYNNSNNQPVSSTSMGSQAQPKSQLQSSPKSVSADTIATPVSGKNPYDAVTEELNAKKSRLAENITNFQEHVSKELSNEEVSDIRKAFAAIEEGNIDETVENRFKAIFATHNIEVIYHAIYDMGPSVLNTFISVLTSIGSSDKIIAFANVVKDDADMLRTLYVKCSSGSARAQILRLMPSELIFSMIASGQISDLSEINPSLLYEFLMRNMSTMTLSSISQYLKYLPYEDRENIVALLNGKNAKDSDKDILADTADNNDEIVNKPQESQNEPEVQPQIKAGEMTAIRNDGVKIKRKDSFGAMSNNDYTESVEEVTERTGLSKAQQDEILTPGSPEWLRKYNKQQDVPPATAFTMAALNEDEEDFGMNFGSNKVGMGKRIRKKYPPQSFRFNA